MVEILAALGIAAALEGLVLLVWSDRLDDLAEMLSQMSPGAARLCGLTLVAGGGGLYLFATG